MKPLVEIRVSPGRGRGLFARTAIGKNEIFLAEPPLAFSGATGLPPLLQSWDSELRGKRNQLRLALRLVHSIVNDGVHIWERMRHLARAANYPRHDEILLRERVYPTIPGAKEIFIPDRWIELLSILSINTFAMHSGESALFFTGSFLNHSCEPNSELVPNTGQFQTLRDVDADEELFVSYVDPSLQLEARQAHLYQNYGFKCSCIKCRS